MRKKINFQTFFNSGLENVIIQLESQRKKVVLSFMLKFLVVLITGAGLIVFLISLFSLTVLGIPVALIILAIFMFSIITFISSTKNYRKNYKENILGKFIDTISSEYKYFIEKGISRDLFLFSGLYPQIQSLTDYHAEDLIISKSFDKYLCLISDIKSSVQILNRTATVFNGIFSLTGVGKKYVKPIVIKAHRIEKKSYFGFPPMNFKKWANKTKRLVPVSFNDQEFNNIFAVYAEDKKEALEILTANMREAILKMSQELGSDVQLSFYKGILFIAISLKQNPFEPPVFRKLKYELIRNDFIILDYLMNISEILELDISLFESDEEIDQMLQTI